MSFVTITLIEGSDRRGPVNDRKYSFQTNTTTQQDLDALPEITKVESGFNTVLPESGDYILFNLDTSALDIYIERGGSANLSSAALNNKINSVIMRLLPNGTESAVVPGFFSFLITMEFSIDPDQGPPNFYYGTAIDNPNAPGTDEYDYSGWVIGRKA